MKKRIKRILVGIAAFFCVVIMTGCTKSFCTVSDTAAMYSSTLTATKQTDIINSATKANIFTPGDAYWTYIDTKVEEAFTADTSDPDNAKYAPVSYVKSYLELKNAEQAKPANLEAIRASHVNETTLKAIIRYSGFDSNKNQTLWANFDKWTEEARNDPTLRPVAPTVTFLNYYKRSISTAINGGRPVTCLSPDSGYFGASEDIYISGKSWGQAFSEFGFIEGLLVYPIGWLVYTFANNFGAVGVNAGGQILAIFLVTLIVRLLIVLVSARSMSSQRKMTELQPQIAMLQSKYPNSQSNKIEQQKLAQETMALYRKNNVHPFRQFLVLIVQFPLFIAVWGALQGSAILTRGSIFGLSLATVTQTAMTSGTAEAPFAIILYVMMGISQFFSSLLPMWMQNWHKKKNIGAGLVKTEENNSTQMMMKWMPVMMMAVIIFMGLQLPAAMVIYWFFGAIISIFQTVITEIILAKKKGNKKYSDKNSSNSGSGFNKRGTYKSQSPARQKHMKLR